MYEAVILDPWASWGVADRIVELEKVLVKWSFQVLVQGSAEGALRRGRSGMAEAEVKDLVAEGIDGVPTKAQHFVQGRDLSKS